MLMASRKALQILRGESQSTCSILTRLLWLLTGNKYQLVLVIDGSMYILSSTNWGSLSLVVVLKILALED